MTTITLEVSEQAASEFQSMASELPLLLNITRQLFRPGRATTRQRAFIDGDPPTPYYLLYQALIK